jgi:hypothetical protein
VQMPVVGAADGEGAGMLMGCAHVADSPIGLRQAVVPAPGGAPF